MSILTADQIANSYPNMVVPLMTRQVSQGMSYGLSYAGVDIRAKEKLVLWPSTMCSPFNRNTSFGLNVSMEMFDMPHDVMGMVKDKSTWARKGLSVFNTVIEPGWTGYLTLELVNHSRTILTIEEGSPIAQVIFHKLEGYCRPYDGKYNYSTQVPQGPKYECE